MIAKPIPDVTAPAGNSQTIATFPSEILLASAPPPNVAAVVVDPAPCVLASQWLPSFPPPPHCPSLSYPLTPAPVVDVMALTEAVCLTVDSAPSRPESLTPPVAVLVPSRPGSLRPPPDSVPARPLSLSPVRLVPLRPLLAHQVRETVALARTTHTPLLSTAPPRAVTHTIPIMDYGSPQHMSSGKYTEVPPSASPNWHPPARDVPPHTRSILSDTQSYAETDPLPGPTPCLAVTKPPARGTTSAFPRLLGGAPSPPPLSDPHEAPTQIHIVDVLRLRLNTNSALTITSTDLLSHLQIFYPHPLSPDNHTEAWIFCSALPEESAGSSADSRRLECNALPLRPDNILASDLAISFNTQLWGAGHPTHPPHTSLLQLRSGPTSPLGGYHEDRLPSSPGPNEGNWTISRSPSPLLSPLSRRPQLSPATGQSSSLPAPPPTSKCVVPPTPLEGDKATGAVHPRFCPPLPARLSNRRTNTSARRSAQSLCSSVDVHSLLPGSEFPPASLRGLLAPLWGDLYVAPSLFCPGQLSLRCASSLRRGDIIGLYGGRIHIEGEPMNPYSMNVTNSPINVDGTPNPCHPWTWLGYMNCHRACPEENNVTVNSHLVAHANCDIKAHTELCIDYSYNYDWFETDLLRLQTALRFVISSAPLLGADRWLVDLSHLSSLLGSVHPSVTLPTILADVTLFTLWHTLTQSIRQESPRLLHSFIPSAMEDDSLPIWLSRFCSCSPIEHLLSWKDPWGGGHELKLPSLIPNREASAPPRLFRAAQRPPVAPDHLCPLSSLRADLIVPWNHPTYGITHWALLLLDSSHPTSPSSPSPTLVLSPCCSPTPSLPALSQPHTTSPPPHNLLGEGPPNPTTLHTPRSPSVDSDTSSTLTPSLDLGRDRGLPMAAGRRERFGHKEWKSLDNVIRLPNRMPHTHFKLLTLNVGVLSDTKLRFILWYMDRQRIDVVSLLDTRHGAASTKSLKDMCQHLGAPGTTVYQMHVPTPAHHHAGGFFSILSPRASQHRIDAWTDKTQTGAASALLFKFQADTVALVSTYWPVTPLPQGRGGLCARVQAKLDLLHDDRSPHLYIRDSITAQLEIWRRGERCFNPIIMGDFNTDLHSSTETPLAEWMARNSMEPIGTPNPTRKDSSTGRGGCLDHALVTTPFIHRWSSYTDDPIVWDSISDHFPLLACTRVDFRPPLKVRPLKDLRPDLNLGNEVDCIIFSDAVEEWVLQCPALPPAMAGEALKELADFCAHTTWEINRDLVKSRRRMRAKSHQLWSPMLMVILARQVSIASARRLLLSKNLADARLQQRLQGLEDAFRSKALKLKDGEATLQEFLRRHPLRVTDFLQMGSRRKALRASVLARKELTKASSSANSKRLRKQIAKAVKHREEAFESGNWGPVIKSMTGERSPQVDLSILRDPATGKLSSVPKANALLTTSHFDQWFNPIAANSFGDFEVDLGNSESHKLEFMNRCDSAGIPSDLGSLIWTSIHHTSCSPPDNPSSPSLRSLVEQEMESALASPPSLEEFNEHLDNCPTDSAAGVSGLSYNMMHKWGPATRQFAYTHLRHLWLDRETPDWWKWRFLVPIGKGEEQPETDLSNVRPLMLLEPLRKAWTGIFNLRFRRIREKHGILNESQHGFRPRRGCSDALMQTHNLLESVHEMSDKLYLSTWDIKRAFDSITKRHIRLAARRAGCPEKDADWLSNMDIGEKTIVRSPYLTGLDPQELRRRVLADPRLFFSAERGTPQGDVLSPDVWDMFFDILLTALELDSTKRNSRCYYTDLQGQACFSRDTAFADDLLSHARTRTQFQRKADIVSAFAIIFGLTLLPTKIRAFICDWTGTVQTPEHFHVHTWGWAPSRVTFDKSGVVKYLGSLISVDLKGVPELEKIRAMIQKSLAVIQRRKASVRLKFMVSTVSTMAKARYGASFASLTLSQLRSLDAPLNSFFRRSLNLMPSFPSHLLYMPQAEGGLALPCLSEAVLKARVRMIQRSPVRDTQAAIAGMLARHRRRLGRAPVPGLRWCTHPLDFSAFNYEPSFLSAPLQWLTEMDRSVAQDGIRTNVLSRGIIDSALTLGLLDDAPQLTAHDLHSSLVRVECQTLGEALHTGELPIRMVNDTRVRAFFHGAGSPLLVHLPTDITDHLAEDDAQHISLLHHGNRTMNSQRGHHSTTMYLRPHQCWCVLLPVLEGDDIIPGVTPMAHEIIEILAFSDSPDYFYGRRWRASLAPGRYCNSRTRFQCAQMQEGVGLHTSQQRFPISDLISGPQSAGFLATMSPDIVTKFPDGTRSVHRVVRDSGLRINVLHPFQASPPPPSTLEGIPGLTQFRDACSRLGPHILCTDGAWKRCPTAIDQVLASPGHIAAGAAIVALPTAPLLPHERCPLPALFIDDSHGDAQSAYPMELLALSLAQWTGAQTRCSWIYSDCKSALRNLGRTKPTSEFFIIDQLCLPPFVCPMDHVKAHQDDKRPFLKLELKAQGNVLADDVASRNFRHPNVKLCMFRLTVREALECGKRGNVVWGALPQDPKAIPGLTPLHKLALQSRSMRYWTHRTRKSRRTYDWTLGHVRHAARASQLKTRSLLDQASFVRLIHDKYWRGNQHNPEVTVCPHCATLPFPDNDFPSVGYSHWLRDCLDPKVVAIRKSRDDVFLRILASAPAPLVYFLRGFASIIQAEPLAFMGRFSESSHADLRLLLANLPPLSHSELPLFTAMSSAGVEAGRSLQALATPEQEIAWRYVCEARKDRMAKTSTRKKATRSRAASRRKARRAIEESLRIPTIPSQRTLGALPVFLPPPSQRSIRSYYGNPAGSDSRHDGDRLFGD